MTVLIYDTSPGPGGAVTSLGALVPIIQQAGFEVRIVAAHRRMWEAEGLGPFMVDMPVRFMGAQTGAAYMAREAARAAVLTRIGRRVGARVIIANNAPTSNMAAYVAGPALGIYVLQYLRAPFWASGPALSALRRARQIFAVGTEVADSLSKLGISPDRWTTVPEGLSTDRWPTLRKPTADRWFWCSVHNSWKGMPMLLKVYEQVRGRMPVPDLDI